MAVHLIYDPSFPEHDTGAHPRMPDVSKPSSSSWKRMRISIDARSSTIRVRRRRKTLSVVTTEEMVAHIKSACERGEPSLDVDTRISPESFEVAKLAAGAAIVGVDAAMKEEGGRAFGLIRPPGHHATPDDRDGILSVQQRRASLRDMHRQYGLERVLIIDWDVHHGNGTQDIFWTDPSVFYFSTHQYPYYPGTGARNERGGGRGEGFTLNIPLAAGTPAQRSSRRPSSTLFMRSRTSFHRI